MPIKEINEAVRKCVRDALGQHDPLRSPQNCLDALISDGWRIGDVQASRQECLPENALRHLRCEWDGASQRGLIRANDLWFMEVVRVNRAVDFFGISFGDGKVCRRAAAVRCDGQSFASEVADGLSRSIDRWTAQVAELPNDLQIGKSPVGTTIN
jgi:hypothetical protein